MKLVTDGVVSLRAFVPEDLPILQEWERLAAVDQQFNYFSEAPTRRLGESPPPDVSRMLVTLADGTPIGDMSWHTVAHGPGPRCAAYQLGISLAAEHRGKGYGARAQRLLADHLFATTGVFRVEASTDIENVAEQRSLERAGFVREGILRRAQYRADDYHDLVLYSRLRSD